MDYSTRNPSTSPSNPRPDQMAFRAPETSVFDRSDFYSQPEGQTRLDQIPSRPYPPLHAPSHSSVDPPLRCRTHPRCPRRRSQNPQAAQSQGARLCRCVGRARKVPTSPHRSRTERPAHQPNLNQNEKPNISPCLHSQPPGKVTSAILPRTLWRRLLP